MESPVPLAPEELASELALPVERVLALWVELVLLDELVLSVVVLVSEAVAFGAVGAVAAAGVCVCVCVCVCVGWEGRSLGV